MEILLLKIFSYRYKFYQCVMKPLRTFDLFCFVFYKEISKCQKWFVGCLSIGYLRKSANWNSRRYELFPSTIQSIFSYNYFACMISIQHGCVCISPNVFIFAISIYDILIYVKLNLKIIFNVCKSSILLQFILFVHHLESKLEGA